MIKVIGRKAEILVIMNIITIIMMIKVIGRKAEEVADMAVEHYQLPYTGNQYLEIHQVKCFAKNQHQMPWFNNHHHHHDNLQERMLALLPTCQPLPGVERLVCIFYDHPLSFNLYDHHHH